MPPKEDKKMKETNKKKQSVDSKDWKEPIEQQKEPQGINPGEKEDSTLFDSLEHKVRVINFQIIIFLYDYISGI